MARGNLIAIGAVAGIIGPLLFTVGFIVQGLFRHDEYDPIAETVSALEAGPNGWIQQLNFFVFGILMMIFGAGLGFGLRTRRRRIASAIVLWWAVGLLMAGLFPLRENADGQTYDPTGLHQPNGAVFFLSTWVGLAILSWCLRPDARWRGLTRYTLTTSVALALLVCCAGRFRDTVRSSVAAMGRPAAARSSLQSGSRASSCWQPGCGRSGELSLRTRWRANRYLSSKHGARPFIRSALHRRPLQIRENVLHRLIRGLATGIQPIADLCCLPLQYRIQSVGRKVDVSGLHTLFLAPFQRGDAG